MKKLRHIFFFLCPVLICILLLVSYAAKPDWDDFKNAYIELQTRDPLHYSSTVTITVDSESLITYSEYISASGESVYITSNSNPGSELTVLTIEGQQLYTMENMDGWLPSDSTFNASQPWMSTPFDFFLNKSYSTERKAGQILFFIEYETGSSSEYWIKNGKITQIKYATKLHTTQNDGSPVTVDTMITCFFHNTPADQCISWIREFKSDAGL
nr:hypothetical protein [Oscillospiraceae bacterium]